jgi:hypothetical protein
VRQVNLVYLESKAMEVLKYQTTVQLVSGESTGGDAGSINQ